MFKGLKKTYNEYPRLFWIIVFTLFIDSLGSTLLFPFFALYITQKFGVGMTQAGILLGMSSLFGLLGSILGGALTDRFGRRKLILFGLVFSALSSLLFGLAWNIRMMYGLVVIVGLLSRIAAPAQDAMMADILPESKRQEGFGITRVTYNFAWIFGTALGGLIAARSFMMLFVLDAVLSLIVAAILFRFLPETKPASRTETRQEESLLKTAQGYRIVLRDLGYVVFTLAGMMVLIVYQQQYSSLAVYLQDIHNISPRAYGSHAFHRRAGGGTLPVLGQPPDAQISTLSDDGAGLPFLYGRFRHDRLCTASMDLPGGGGHHYVRGNDHVSHQQGPGNQLLPREYARAVYGNLRSGLDDPRHARAGRGRADPG